MKTINHSELFELLKNIKGATIVAMTATTTPKMNKTCKVMVGEEEIVEYNPYYKDVVTKVSERENYQFGYNYENGVNNRLEAQGCEATFKSEELPWGAWEVTNKIISHKGNLYGRFYRMANSIEKNAYFINGVKATKEEVETIKKFLPKPKGSNRQENAGLAEHQVEPMTFAFASIDEIRVNGETYKVSHNEAEIEAA